MISELATNKFLWQWGLVIAVLAGLIYTMIVIGKEKKTYLEQSKNYQHFELILPIPSWWSLTSSNLDCLHFVRSDTRYDWFAQFSYIRSDDHQDLTKVLRDFLEKWGIEYDQDVDITTDPRFLFKDKKFATHFSEFIRTEGTATEGVNIKEAAPERIYLDIILFRKDHSPNFYFYQSKSSVLNGSVEGPYFEEAVARANFANHIKES